MKKLHIITFKSIKKLKMISLPFKLKTNTAIIYDIPEECINNFKAIVLSDHHFGLCRDIKKVFLFLNQS